MKEKIKIIFIPTLLTFLGLIIIYTFLNWILFIKLELFGLKEIITNVWIPIILAALAAWILIQPKLKMLRLNAKRGVSKELYCLILWIVFTSPLIVAQEYIVTASGQFTELNSIEEINNTQKTKYYLLRNFYIDKKRVSIHSSFDGSFSKTHEINMHIYVVLPIFSKASDTTKSDCSAWLGVEYQETISPSEFERKYQAFSTRSKMDFDRKDVSKFIYLDSVGNSSKKDGLIEAIKNNTFTKGDQTILVPINETFESRNGNKLIWIFGSSLIGLSIWLIMILIPKIDENNLRLRRVS